MVRSKTELVVSYLEFVSDIVATRDKLDSPLIHLSFLVPYWFDGSNGEAPQVEVDTVADYPFQHLQARDFDEVTWIVMAYRDRSSSTTWSICRYSPTVKQFRTRHLPASVRGCSACLPTLVARCTWRLVHWHMC